MILKKTDRKLKKQLRKILGFSPKKLSLYRIAFIHRSASITRIKKRLVNNERLEFLGDAVLDTVVSDYLYRKYPFEYEGFLTKTRSKIVNTEKLAYIAKGFNLQSFLRTKVADVNNNICGDALEAFIGAVYLDRGYKKATKFIENKIIKEHIDIEELIKTETNHKSNILEWAQKNNNIIIFKTKEDVKTKDTFVAKIIVNDEVLASGRGKSKKIAEQMSALKALKKIDPHYNYEKITNNNSK